MRELLFSVLLAASITLNIFFVRNWYTVSFTLKPTERLKLYLMRKESSELKPEPEDEIDWNAYSQCLEEIRRENEERRKENNNE